MYPRKRFEISTRDLLLAPFRSWLQTAFHRHPTQTPRQVIQQKLEQHWAAQGEGVACLSVRTGLDLLLQTLQLPHGSEVLVSALNIPDMGSILEAHGMVPVAVEIDLATALPTLSALEAKRTVRTRALLVAQLFGGRGDLNAIADYCRRHQLALWEDNAQAYDGREYRGHPRADVAFFSFGSIKSATALGGAMLTISDHRVAKELRQRRDRLPLQAPQHFFKRCLKTTLLKLLTQPPIYALLVRAIELSGRELEKTLHGWVRGFSGQKLLVAIRQQAPLALLRLLARRLEHVPVAQLAKRRQRGEQLRRALGSEVEGVGRDQRRRGHWVFPILVDDPVALSRFLRQQRFDAATQATLAPYAGAPETDVAWQRVLYLPCDAGMPPAEVERLASLVRSYQWAHQLTPRDRARGRTGMVERVFAPAKRATTGQ